VLLICNEKCTELHLTKLNLVFYVPDNADDWSLPESNATIRRLQRQMFTLLAKYCAIDSRQHQHKVQVAAAAELAVVNPISAASGNSENADFDDIITQMEISIYEILSNVTTLCTALVSKSGQFYVSCCLVWNVN